MLDFTLYSPESVGVSSDSIAEFLLRGNELGLHSFILFRHGKCISESYFAPYAKDKLHMLYSLSKSFTSIACAFAVQDGLLAYEDRVAGFFPDKMISAGFAELTVEHLLTMSVGTEEGDRFSGFDWIQDFLSAEPEHKPGSVFRYDTSATFMVAAILERVLGRSIECYLTDKLFSKISIDNHWWQRSPDGICTGGYGLNLRTRDLARFASFIMNRGSWEGEQLLDPALIERATSKHIENGVPVAGQPCDWAMGYGYQFWRCEPDGVFRGDGAFGQYMIFMPKQDAFIAINSGTPDMQAILTAIWKIILPAMADIRPDNPEAEAKLREIETTRHITYPEGTPYENVPEGVFTFKDKKVSFTIENDLLCMYLHEDEKKTIRLRAGYNRFVDCGGNSYAYAVKDGELIFREVHSYTPYGNDCILRFEGETVAERTAPFSGCVHMDHRILN
ncbi:MAG: serine hydrolase [Clostridia bacterium]|nr:serine hydrolase [Clostridia bacterium]